MGVDGVVVDVLVQDRAEVFHRGYAQNRTGNMDNRVHIGKADIHNGIATHCAIAFSDSIKATQGLRAFYEIFRVLCRKRSATQRNSAIYQRAGGLGNATFGIDARTIGSA